MGTIQPLETVQITVADGTEILLRRMSSHPTRRFLFSHGNGLAIAGYEAFWKLLLDDAEVIVFDFRNHGLNPPAPPSTANNWVHFVSDLDEILARLDDFFGSKPTYGVFHSMSALTSMIHASTRPSGWQGLVLFEPPAVPPEGTSERAAHIESQRDLVAKTRARRSAYDSPEHLSRSFSRLPMFRRMPDAVRLQLARATLRRTADGNYALACPPNFEADTFTTWEIAPHWERFSAIGCPVLIVTSAAGDSDTPLLSVTGRMLADEFGFAFAQVQDAGHLLQLDRPERCAELVRSFFGG